MKKILLLGHTGKMGLALQKILAPDYQLVGMNSANFNAADFEQVAELVREQKPELIINAIAFQGIDQCEAEPETAFRLNTLFPGFLARICEERKITFVHFSTDAVFADAGEGFCTENHLPSPLNLYGVTKYGGDCLVSSNCRQHFICRIPILFGESRGASQFVEKMLARLRGDDSGVRVAADIVSSPSYSLDIASRVRELLQDGAPYGTYHLANEGAASLYELMAEIAANLIPGAVVEKASYRDFPFVGRKNIHTPLRSVRIESLRPWREAVQDYCCRLQAGAGTNG
jgi:dTDP-4-dehydrorhamnose reductase